MLSFEQFQALGRDVPDVEYVAQDEAHRPGRVYPGPTYIELVDHALGKYMLVLNRDDWITNDLASLERRLYEFCKDEGVLTARYVLTKDGIIDSAGMLHAVDTASRELLMDFCQWNDPNGCWTDEDMMREFGRVGTVEDMREIVRDWQRTHI